MSLTLPRETAKSRLKKQKSVQLFGTVDNFFKMSIKIKHLTPLVQIFNMPRSLAFYREILGFEIVMDSGNGDRSSWVWIKRMIAI